MTIERGYVTSVVQRGAIFPQKDIYKLTWRSPDGRTENQIDHVLVNGNNCIRNHSNKMSRGIQWPLPCENENTSKVGKVYGEEERKGNISRE